jgi:hypothetical protein
MQHPKRDTHILNHHTRKLAQRSIEYGLKLGSDLIDPRKIKQQQSAIQR